MLPARRCAFNFLGGFAITDFYVSCTDLAEVQEELSRHGSAQVISPSYLSLIFGQKPEIPKVPQASSTLREDAELFFHHSPLAGAALVFAAVSFGGTWSLLGSAAAIAVGGDDGIGRYSAVKQWLGG
uniref:Uncharacterized protein n=1 Tax=Trypanosoma congolense (strain IL3000) TaxID=1068625 RepID=G0UTJ1_TRYCI|nr:conserved hypothetical protein [Trypanosoma congolense IL3000]